MLQAALELFWIAGVVVENIDPKNEESLLIVEWVAAGIVMLNDSLM